MGPNRRGFLRTLMSLPGVAALLEGIRPVPPAAQAAERDVYKELGVRPLINAAGSYTTLSATLMPREVVEAIESASRRYVSIPELHEVVGKKIAARIGCEAALVTAGAASALTLGAAACVAGKDPEKIRRLPDTTGMKNEVILQKSHRNGYDHAVRNVGTRLVEIETREDVERAVNARTALMLFFHVHEPDGRIKVGEFVQLAKKQGVPAFIDIAANVPPAENLWRFIKMGYDLVALSGGKGLRGPQCAGLLFGRRDLVEAAVLNNNPHSDSVARTNKVGKEEIVGMWAAVERFLKLDHPAVWREWEGRCKTVAGLVGSVPGIKTEIFVPEISNSVPHLRITWDYAASGLSPAAAVKKLRDGEPRIELRPGAKDGLEIAVWTLEPGEERIVGQKLQEILKKG